MSAPWVVPIVQPPIRDGAILVDEGTAGGGATIVAVGSRASLRRDHPDLPETRAEGAVLPGLVNAHAHLELSALAGQVAGGDGVVAWTRRLAERLGAGRAATGDKDADAADAAIDAARGARAFGTAAIADVGNGCAGWRAMKHADLRGVFFHELVGSREARTGDAIADAAAERAAVADTDRPRDVAAVPAPHAPYSVGPALLRRIFSAAADARRATTIHLGEDLDELRLLRDGTGAWADVLRAMGVAPETRAPGLGPTAYLDSLGAFAGPCPPLLVHMVHADDDDRRRARDAGATVVLCPRSNLHIGGRLPDVGALIRDGVRLAIGTDSLASAPDLSPWAEISTLAAALPDVAPRVWLHGATVGGATAIGLDALGAIAIGRRPGLIDVAPADGGQGDVADARGPGDVERLLTTAPNPRIRWLASA